MAKPTKPTPPTESARLLRAVAHLLGEAYVGAPRVSQKAQSGCTHDAANPSRLTVVVNAPHNGTLRSERYILTRAYGDFSDAEVSLCDEIAQGASILWEQFDPSGRRLHIRTAVNESGPLIGISRFLRAKAGLRSLSIGMRQRVREISLGVPSLRSDLAGVEAEDGDEPNDSHANSRISASTFSSQNRMSISRYIVVAVARCSWASSRLSMRR